MFSHVFLSVTDFDRALAFYEPLMRALGNKQRFCERDTPWAGWQGPDQTRPLFVICHPYDGQSHDSGNGQMVAFIAMTRSHVREVHRIAIENGGRSEGEPGPRPQYHADYYGAYFRDPDGNKLCVACHEPDQER